MEPQKTFFYPTGDFNSIPEKWLNDDDLRVKLAQMERLETNPNWAIINSENNIDNMKFDIIYSTNFIEHLINPIQDIKEMLKHLNMNGYIIN